MNRVIVSGSIKADPVVLTHSTGNKLCIFTLINTDRVAAAASHFEVEVWGELVDKYISDIKKGVYVLIYGYIKQNSVIADPKKSSINIVVKELQFINY